MFWNFTFLYYSTALVFFEIPIVCWISCLIHFYQLFLILFIFLFAFLISKLCSLTRFLWYPDLLVLVLISEMVLSFSFLSSTGFCFTLGTSLHWSFVFLSCNYFVRFFFFNRHWNVGVLFSTALWKYFSCEFSPGKLVKFCYSFILLIRVSLYKFCAIPSFIVETVEVS